MLDSCNMEPSRMKLLPMIEDADRQSYLLGAEDGGNRSRAAADLPPRLMAGRGLRCVQEFGRDAGRFCGSLLIL
ncbi:hypothetical protein KSP40_PGU017464 [Platanthera guangdongensis]|uniref:Uncharacterized protein n=1 Tax=Platanthera guangdongensis TaxID=2320717 RepID=A0ABR2LNA3_9ASPA